MSLFLQRLLDGLADGSLYGSLALALVIVYRSTGRLNMAQGEMATLGTYLVLVLSSPLTPALAGTALASRILPLTPWPIWVAIPAAMLISAAGAAILERLVVRRVADRPIGASVRLGVAMLLLFNAQAYAWWGGRSRPFPSLFPNQPGDYLLVGGARFRWTTIGTWLVLMVLVAGLWLLSNRTKAGLAFRAVAQAPSVAALHGIRVKRVYTASWALAAAIGTLVGSLSAARLVLTPNMMIRLLVFGFVAAAIGGFSSPGGALFGGLIVGVGQSLLGGYLEFVGETLSFPVIVLAMIVMLVVRPRGLFGPATERVAPAGPNRRPSDVVSVMPVPNDIIWRGSRRHRRLQAVWSVVGLVVAVTPVFVLPLIHARTWTHLVGVSVALAGLGVILGPSGQLSLGHVAFMGLGMYTTGIAAGRYGLDPQLGVVIAMVVGGVAGLAIGFPALRIRGQYLAVVTLAVAVVFPLTVSLFSWYTGGDIGPPLIETPQGPDWFPTGGRSYVWFHLVGVTLAVIVIFLLHRALSGRWGRALRASSDDAQAAASVGVNVARTRTLAFGLATALAGLGGGLLAVQTQAVATSQLTVFPSLAVFALVMLSGADSLAGTTLAAVLYVGVPWFITTTGWAIGAQGVAPYSPGGGAYLVWGLGLLIGTLVAPDGLVTAVRRFSRRYVAVVDPALRGLGSADGEAELVGTGVVLDDGAGTT